MMNKFIRLHPGLSTVLQDEPGLDQCIDATKYNLAGQAQVGGNLLGFDLDLCRVCPFALVVSDQSGINAFRVGIDAGKAVKPIWNPCVGGEVAKRIDRAGYTHFGPLSKKRIHKTGGPSSV